LAPQPCASLTLPSSAATATLALHPPLLHHTGARRRNSPLPVPLRSLRPILQHRRVPLRRATGTRSLEAPSSRSLHERRPPPPPELDANAPHDTPAQIRASVSPFPTYYPGCALDYALIHANAGAPVSSVAQSRLCCRASRSAPRTASLLPPVVDACRGGAPRPNPGPNQALEPPKRQSSARFPCSAPRDLGLRRLSAAPRDPSPEPPDLKRTIQIRSCPI